MKQNKKVLDIIIPQYMDGEDVVKTLLDSIAIQQNVDFNTIGVIIINDGTDVRLSHEFLTSYPFEINYWLADHGGISSTRQIGLEISDADYVMFCDSDDCFYSVIGLYTIMNIIKSGQFDMLISEFVEEVMYEGRPLYIVHDKDGIFIHGKVYRNAFLQENNIRWRPELNFHEDVYFNALAARLAKDLRYVTTPFYLWRYNSNSASRQPGFMRDTYDKAIFGNDLLLKEFMNRDMPDIADYYYCYFVMKSYGTMHNKTWDGYQDLKNKTLTQLATYFKQNEERWYRLSDEKKNEISEQLSIEDISVVADWMKTIS